MFDVISDIIAHIRRKHSHQVYVGKDYSVDEVCSDFIRINERMQQKVDRIQADLDKIISRKPSVLELTPEETVKALRAHVNQRGGPTRQNGVWELMLHAANQLEDLSNDSLVGEGEVGDLMDYSWLGADEEAHEEGQ